MRYWEVEKIVERPLYIQTQWEDLNTPCTIVKPLASLIYLFWEIGQYSFPSQIIEGNEVIDVKYLTHSRNFLFPIKGSSVWTIDLLGHVPRLRKAQSTYFLRASKTRGFYL